MKIPAGVSLPKAGKRAAIIAAAAFVAILVLLGTTSGFYTDLLWFKETGYSDVFWAEWRTKWFLGLSFGAIFAIALLINIWVVQKLTNPARVFSMRDQIIERYRLLLRPAMRKIIMGGTVLLGLFAGMSTTGMWRRWLLYRNAQTFGETDPVFGKDLGFFVFKLPFNQFVFSWAFGSLIVITLIVLAGHYLMGGIRTEGPGPRVAPHVKAHLSVLLGLIVALKAWGYRLDQFNLLYSLRGGQVTGASYTDVNAQLPALRLLVIIALVCAVLFFVNIRFRGWILPAAGIGILALTSIVAGGIYPATVQRLRVNPVERELEKPFIQRNIEATRKAFNIDSEHVQVAQLPADATIDSKTLNSNRPTVENIRLWDPDTLTKAYTQLQRITPYYEFAEVDVDRYKLGDGGRLRQVMISAREIDPQQLPSQARTWVNNHLVYTHGYGVVASRVDTATSEGQPDFLIRDIPESGEPVSEEGIAQIKEPRIYFGEQESQPFVIVNSNVEELDFPVGQTGFKSSSYKGKGGIEMSNILRRAAFAWRFRDVNLLISGAIRGDSRIMFRREVSSRVQQVAPFLQVDGDPYIVIADGRLVWMQDAYTLTANYPYSQRIDIGALTNGHLRGSANYIRNSVKATVDALDGTIRLYVWDDTDPIVKTWAKAFPKLLLPKSEMPAQVAEHVRYPEDLFLVQADRYATYHITDPVDFYSKNDVWRIPGDPSASEVTARKLPPYYVLMKLPRVDDADGVEFVIMLPFAPFSGENQGTPRQNMTAWLAARMDGDNYGKMVSFVYSKEKNVFGPEQVDARIENDPIVRSVKTQLDPQNRRIQKGNLLVIPIGEGVLYVQPLYLIATSSTLPELKRVVVATGDKIRIGETLAEAVAALFGQQAPDPGTGEPPPTSTDLAALIAEAIRHFQLAEDALRRGDLGLYQRELAAARRALDQAQRQLGGPQASPSPSPSPTAG